VTHAHTWRLLASYPWERGLVSKHHCPDCGKVLKLRYEWPQPRPARRPEPAGEGSAALSGLGGFLVGVGFATFVFAVAVLRGCVHLPPQPPGM